MLWYSGAVFLFATWLSPDHANYFWYSLIFYIWVCWSLYSSLVWRVWLMLTQETMKWWPGDHCQCLQSPVLATGHRAGLSCIMCAMYTRAWNKAYPKVREDFTIMEKAPTRSLFFFKGPKSPSRGFLRDCKIFANVRITFVLSSNVYIIHYIVQCVMSPPGQQSSI